MTVNLIVFLFGLVIGSFLNVCIYRIPKGRSVVSPPSHCPHCRKNIRWYDNIPVFSFVLLGGRCRFCKAPISLRYPLVEIITAVIITLLFAAFGVSARFFAYSLMGCGLVIATFVDFEINEIPDQVSVGGLVAGIVLSTAFPPLVGAAAWPQGLLNSVIGMLAGGGSIYLMGLLGELVFKREAMGGGDVKLMAMIGAFLGWKLAVMTFFIAPFFGAVVGVIMRMRDGREIIPYGPYLSLAALISVFFGEKILELIFYGLL